MPKKDKRVKAPETVLKVIRKVQDTDMEVVLRLQALALAAARLPVYRLPPGQNMNHERYQQIPAGQVWEGETLLNLVGVVNAEVDRMRQKAR